jgi:hypothetical protein
MKKWKIIKVIAICILIFIEIYVIIAAIASLNMEYPHDVFGVGINNWVEQFFYVDMQFFLAFFSIPIIIDVILLIVSIRKIKKYDSKKTQVQENS